MRAEGFSSVIVGADRCSIRAHALLCVFAAICARKEITLAVRE